MYQRPQHLLSRMTGYFRVFYFEEPVLDADLPRLEKIKSAESVWVLTPHLPSHLTGADQDIQLAKMLQDMIDGFEIKEFVAWFYTPLALSYSRQTKPRFVIFDCMDELSAFQNASPALVGAEAALLKTADLVFTGGYSLFNAKRDKHHNIHLFPSSIDAKHFEQARNFYYQMDDQANIPEPRIGFFGVVDERMDLDLLQAVARRKPEWSFVIIGPVVKIDRATLPRLSIFIIWDKSHTPNFRNTFPAGRLP